MGLGRAVTRYVCLAWEWSHQGPGSRITAILPSLNLLPPLLLPPLPSHSSLPQSLVREYAQRLGSV